MSDEWIYGEYMKLTKPFADIRERLENATPGPWGINKDFYAGEHSYISAGNVPHMARIDKEPGKRYANGELIANAPTDIARLLAALDVAVEALEKVCKRNDIEEAVLDYYGDCAMALKKIEALSSESRGGK